MSLSGIFHPTRDGARGGRAEFSWGNVAADKYRENYLGHSVMAPVGRWQKGRDLAWYAREAARTGRTAEELEAEELARVRDQEAELLAEALGYKGPKKHLAPPAVSQDELQQAIRREQDGGEGPEGVKGVGFGRKGLEISGQTVERLEGQGGPSLSGFRPTGSNTVPVEPSRRDDGQTSAAAAPKEDNEEAKKRKKAEKEERKRRKQERKEEKERKRKDRERRHRSPDSSDDSLDDDRKRRRRDSRSRSRSVERRRKDSRSRSRDRTDRDRRRSYSGERSRRNEDYGRRDRSPPRRRDRSPSRDRERGRRRDSRDRY